MKTLDQIFKTPLVKSGFSLKEMVKNIPGSAKQFATDIFSAFRHPIKTAKAITDIGEGAIRTGIEKIAGKDLFKDERQEKAFDAVVDFFRKRYGGKEAIARTIQEDPVGFASDVATLITGVGSVLKGGARVIGGRAIGAVPKSELNVAGRVVRATERTGGAIQKFGKAVEPINIATKTAGAVAKPVAKIAGKFASEISGVATGQGGDVIRAAFKAAEGGSEEFKEALQIGRAH